MNEFPTLDKDELLRTKFILTLTQRRKDVQNKNKMMSKTVCTLNMIVFNSITFLMKTSLKLEQYILYKANWSSI